MSLDDNNGFYFIPGNAPGTVTPAPNAYTLMANASATPGGASPIDTATYGTTIYLTATLAPNSGNTETGNGVGDLVTFQIGNQYAYAVTGSGGVASTSLTLDQPPGSDALTANYVGDTNDQAATFSESFTIGPEATSLEVNAAGNLLSATLTTSGGTAIPFQTVVFDIDKYNDVGDVLASTTGETNGRGVADAQTFTVPPGMSPLHRRGVLRSVRHPRSRRADGGRRRQPRLRGVHVQYDDRRPHDRRAHDQPHLAAYPEPATLTATVTPPPRGEGRSPSRRSTTARPPPYVPTCNLFSPPERPPARCQAVCR